MSDNQSKTRSWTVLLIGGSSGTGKSTLARQIVEHYKIPLTEADDIRIAIQSVLDNSSNPDLFYFLTNPDYIESDVPPLVEKLMDVGKEVWKPLNQLIDKHIVCNEPVVFEGDSIIPSLLAKRDQDKIKAIFLYEDDKQNLKERNLKRDRGIRDIDMVDKEAEFSFAVGQELKKQAEENGYMTIQASPIENLLDRVLSKIDL